jgi:ABC-type transport system involved in multi-copper enzyme maturation permease subunit
MVGPVLYQEMLLATRRNRVRIFRYGYAAWTLIIPCIFAVAELGSLVATGAEMPGQFTNRLIAGFLTFLIWQHYLVLLLAAPVLTAGAITDEKWRGTLQYLLVTELYSWEILAGKLLARLHTVLLIALTPLPWICFLGVFGGIDPLTLLMLFVTTTVLAYALGCMSLLASVLCRNTRDAILGFYTIGALALYGGNALWALLASSFAGATTGPEAWLTRAVECLDPFQPVGPEWNGGSDEERWYLLLTAVVIWGLLGSLFLVAAALRLRASYLRYLENTGKRSWGPVLFAWVAASSLLGTVAFVVYTLLTGSLADYLDGTATMSFARAFRDFLALWDGAALLLLAVLIGFLALKRGSGTTLDNLHQFRQRFWLTRRGQIKGDPLRWKERHLEGVAPLAILRQMPRWLGAALILLFTTLTSLAILARSLESPHTPGGVVRALLDLDFDALLTAYETLREGTASKGFFWQGIFVLLLATLVIGIRCAGTVSQEREKNTWEALLLTPLTTRQLIRSKLWGIIGASLLYLAAYGVPALAFAAVGGAVPVLWVALWLGVTLLAMTFIGSAGLWCSVRTPGSLWSLLGTLGIGYIGGFLVYAITFFFGIMASCIFVLIFSIIDRFFGTNMARSPRTIVDAMWIVSAVLLAGSFALMAWWFVVQAEYRVGVMERTKHWRDEAKHPRWSKYAREEREKARQRDTSERI